MSDYTVLNLAKAEDRSGDYPGEVKMIKNALESKQTALTYRKIEPNTGSIRGSRRGHRHKTQEEVIFVIAGTLTVKIEDELIELGPKTAIRIAPGVAQDCWNYGKEPVEMLIISTYIENLMDDLEIISDFWEKPKL